MRASRHLLVAAVAARFALGSADLLPCDAGSCPLAIEPEWVRAFPLGDTPGELWLNYGASPDTMVVFWATSNKTAGSQVQLGTAPGAYSATVEGNSTTYTYPPLYTSPLLHHAWLTGLSLNTTYYYRVGDAAAWSAEASFVSSPGVGASAAFFPRTIGVIADVGESLDAINTVAHMQARLSIIDELIIAGDLSYASGCEKTLCPVWDAFGGLMQPLSRTKPFAINIGNHELADDANGIPAISTQYRYGAGMPHGGRADGALYFSWEAGPAHYISLCSFIAGGFGAAQPISQWLLADLQGVDRSKTPWLIVIVHAPPYNSNTAHQGEGEPLRVAYEPLFTAHKVSILFSGHVHAYQRSHPVTNNGTVQADGQGTVYLNIGDGGASLYTEWLPAPTWSAYQSAEFGLGHLTLLSPTTAHWGWYRNADNATVETDAVIIKNFL